MSTTTNSVWRVLNRKYEPYVNFLALEQAFRVCLGLNRIKVMASSYGAMLLVNLYEKLQALFIPVVQDKGEDELISRTPYVCEKLHDELASYLGHINHANIRQLSENYFTIMPGYSGCFWTRSN